MFQLEGDGKYMDVLERCLFNSFLSGVGITGDCFFYPNRLASSDGARRSAWFPCACCPCNAVRFIPQVPGLFYATGAGKAFVNLYGSGTAQLTVDGIPVRMTQISDYPWSGSVRLEVSPQTETAFTLHVRIPGCKQFL